MFKSIWDSLRQQSRQFGAKLMGLYLLLLLVPVCGVGLYGHFYIQRTLSQYVLNSELDTVRAQASMINTLLTEIHHDILYLEQQFSVGAVPSDPSIQINGFSAAHTLYDDIAWVSTDGEILGGHASEQMAVWTETPTFAEFAELPRSSIQIIPVQDSNRETSLIAGAKLDEGLMLIELNSDYLFQGIREREAGNEWSLWIPPGTMITTATTAPNYRNLSLDQFSDKEGYFISDKWVYLYHRTGPGSAWTLIRHLPISVLRADLSNYYLTFLILLSGGLVSIVGLALFAISRIIEPVHQLTERVNDLREGRSPAPFRETLPSDEFGELMMGFDHMAADLERQRQIERALVEQLITAQEEERKLIAYDLHDGLIQKLVGARFYLRSCRQEGIESTNETETNSGYAMLTSAITEGRRIIQGLHPTVLDDLGLEAALEELANTANEDANWELHLRIAPLDEQPDRVTSVTLYRIAQEALNNICKHANASQVWLTLRQFDDRLRLCIRDNGTGFDVANVQPGKREGWGIRTMRERAAMLHGDCEVVSTPSSGTRVRVTIPYVSQELIGSKET